MLDLLELLKQQSFIFFLILREEVQEIAGNTVQVTPIFYCIFILLVPLVLLISKNVVEIDGYSVDSA